ncbi:tyrosine-protein kinase receptor Tie-1-like [Ptychodera flava]|uniref:tyrosine-protein kinase receptor Tie-1-like n=1 Tax=Ptychodera flava TaxID=63121 RepID=UPI00396A67B0
MKHLEELGIVHRYLSPKHILVDWSLHCKISNFGYASNVIDSASFMAKAEGSCPERWMAIESLVDLKFTSKSDVWAFGVVLWHTMTLGETPYASINLIHLAEKLNAGYELPRPPICGQKLCDMIKQCCQISPLQRPKFEELASALNTYTNTAKAYLDLMSYPKHVGID